MYILQIPPFSHTIFTKFISIVYENLVYYIPMTSSIDFTMGVSGSKLGAIIMSCQSRCVLPGERWVL